jgi:hypothetical protein
MRQLYYHSRMRQLYYHSRFIAQTTAAATTVTIQCRQRNLVAAVESRDSAPVDESLEVTVLRSAAIHVYTLTCTNIVYTNVARED